MTKIHISIPLLEALHGSLIKPPPIWLMRQAGRYLPEYRALRERTGSFWTMCMTPDLAAEITLQPIRRFDFDAAIIFSDILVLPYALGQAVRFENSTGPRLDALTDIQALDMCSEHWAHKLAPVYEAIQRVKGALDRGKALIGFAGGPWTLAAYMLEGQGSKDQHAAKAMIAREPAAFAELMAMLCEIVAWHLARQIEAGADVVQIFDSHAGSLLEAEFENYVVTPTKQIVGKLRTRHPDTLIIGFPRGVKPESYRRYAEGTGLNAVSLATDVDLTWAVPALGKRVTLQGNLDPATLVAGGPALDAAIDHIVAATQATPFIFNLGHGVLPETSLTHVERMIKRVRGVQ
jgi:uroporphyrinogen decarboxylase